MTRRAVIAADAGPEHGLGHLSRSSAVAVALRSRGFEVGCLGLGAAGPLVRDGVEWEPTRHADVDLTAADVAVLDSYHLDVAAIAREHPVVTMHDRGGVPDGVRLAVSVAREERDGGPTLLAGPRYACLRPRFWGLGLREPRDPVRSIVLTTGAGDLGGLAGRLAEALRDALPDARLTVVRGPQAGGSLPDGVEVLDAPESLLDVLLGADLVACAAGQTMLEALATGVPCVAVAAVENQAAQAGALAAAGAVRAADAADPVACAAAMARLAGDAAERRALSRRAQQIVDGYGALRVAFAIERLTLPDELAVRPSR